MNKKTKGLISGVVGAGLLLGAGGTFALWFDTAAFGADGDSVVTGLLNLDDAQDGNWIWSAVSNLESEELLGEDFDTEESELVPGDALEYVWTDEDGVIAAEAALSGDTLLARLYLDGTFIANDAIYPLQLRVNGVLVDTAETEFAISDFQDLTGSTELPTVTLHFPALGDTVDVAIRPGDRNPAGPADLAGYGREESFAFNNIENLQLVLLQVVDGDFDGSEG